MKNRSWNASNSPDELQRVLDRVDAPGQLKEQRMDSLPDALPDCKPMAYEFNEYGPNQN